MHTNGTPSRHAFTLLEIIVVIMILGVLSAMIVPRLGGTRLREFNLTVDRINDSVLMFAHRTSTSNQAAALRYDINKHQFELLTKIKDGDEQFWKADALAKPVRLPTWFENDAITVFVDGEIVDTMQYPVTATPGEARPLIEVSVAWENQSALISLPSHSMGPHIWREGIGEEPLMPIDLDAQGRGREEW